MRNVVGEMKQRMHPKIERFTTGCKALGESKKRQLVGMLAGKEYVSGITVIRVLICNYQSSMCHTRDLAI